MVIKETRSDKIFNFINYFLLACVFLICLYPLWFIIIASISNPDLVNGGQVWFWPKDISFDGYKSLFADDGVMRGYVNTLIYTTGGTLINLAVTLPAAYALSRRDFVGRKFFTLMFLFTMFFSGGLIPTFLTVKSLGLYNNPWVMVILGATSMTNIIISRTFFETNIPNELREAAEIDGCSNTRFFFQHRAAAFHGYHSRHGAVLCGDTLERLFYGDDLRARQRLAAAADRYARDTDAQRI